jgi:hypothetical protein
MTTHTVEYAKAGPEETPANAPTLTSRRCQKRWQQRWHALRRHSLRFGRTRSRFTARTPSSDLGSEWWNTQRTSALSMPMPKATVAARMSVSPAIHDRCTPHCIRWRGTARQETNSGRIPAAQKVSCESRLSVYAQQSRALPSPRGNVSEGRACTASRSSAERLAW